MSFSLVNFFNTTLSAASSNTATTFTVSSSANLPTLASGEVLPIILNDAATRKVFEICYVTGISGNILTVERAQEGTSAQNWNVGDFIWNGPTAGTALLTNMPNPFIIPNATASDNPVALNQSVGGASIRAVASIRSANTVYTNTSTRPMFVFVDASNGGSTSNQLLITVSYSGNTFEYLSSEVAAGITAAVSAIVPIGATYELTFNGTSYTGTIYIWNEFS